MLWLLDKESAGAAVSLEADRVLIERNVFGVRPAETDQLPPDDPGFPPQPPSDPCANSDVFYAKPYFVLSYAAAIWAIKFF